MCPVFQMQFGWLLPPPTPSDPELEKITNFYTLDFSLLMESDVLCACFINFTFKIQAESRV